MIEIRKFVEPDLVLTIGVKEKYTNSNRTHTKQSIIFSEQIMVIQECDIHGNLTPYGEEGRYLACRVVDEVIEICDNFRGWIRADEKLQEMYKNEIVDKVILGEQDAGN